MTSVDCMLCVNGYPCGGAGGAGTRSGMTIFHRKLYGHKMHIVVQAGRQAMICLHGHWDRDPSRLLSVKV